MKYPEKKCNKCGDSGWVCESHADKPFEHFVSWGFIKIECGGAGMPCTCNTANPLWNFPDKTRTEVTSHE